MSNIISDIRAVVTNMGPQSGFTPEYANTHSMNAGGSMELLMDRVNT